MKKYVIRGRVVRGLRLGSKLGYPTANLNSWKGDLPGNGVYQVIASSSQFKLPRLGACNVGVRPTVAKGLKKIVEVHFPGFKGNLYGKTLAITFARRLRDELKFKSLAALKRQIKKDVSEVMHHGSK